MFQLKQKRTTLSLLKMFKVGDNLRLIRRSILNQNQNQVTQRRFFFLINVS